MTNQKETICRWLAIATIAVPAIFAQPTASPTARHDVVSSWSADVLNEVDRGVVNAERAVQVAEELAAVKTNALPIAAVSNWPEAYTTVLYTQARRRGLFQDNIETLGSAFSYHRAAATLPRNRPAFGLSSRSKAVAEMIRGVLRREGLPAELLAVPLVESGFDPLALSPKGARGIWQFMPATARRFGLHADGVMDERTDPVRSTVAAARYLRELHARLGNWQLALAAYNAGEDRIERALSISGARDFSTLVRFGLLPEETQLYVPAVLAAADQMQHSGDLARTLPGQSTGVWR